MDPLQQDVELLEAEQGGGREGDGGVSDEVFEEHGEKIGLADHGEGGSSEKEAERLEGGDFLADGEERAEEALIGELRRHERPSRRPAFSGRECLWIYGHN